LRRDRIFKEVEIEMVYIQRMRKALAEKRLLRTVIGYSWKIQGCA